MENRDSIQAFDSGSRRTTPTGPAIDLALMGWRNLLWRLTSWLRWYVRSFPIRRGRGVILRKVVTPTLPIQGRFAVAMPSGYALRIGYRERIGISFAIYGDFEPYERTALAERVQLGTTAIDVGANVGIYALELSKAVGEQGRVLAIEPWPDNVRRLQETIYNNSIKNVRILPCAVGSEPSVVEMHGGGDSAYVTSVPTGNLGAYPETHRIEQSTLDQIWRDAGSARISVVKIDVEGSELEVLKGARQLLASCHPALLCEANSPEKSESLKRFLGEFGYRPHQPVGFEPWNLLFVWQGT